MQFIVTLLDEPTQKWTGDWVAGGQAAPWPSDECMDLVLFPDMLRFRLVSLEQLPAFAKCLIEQLASAGTPDGLKLGDKLAFLPDVPVEVVSGTYVVVCIHRQRDKRCGVAGSLLLDAFDEARHTLGVADRVHLVGTSHIGGHKFAGTFWGHYVGYMAPRDANVAGARGCAAAAAVAQGHASCTRRRIGSGGSCRPTPRRCCASSSARAASCGPTGAAGRPSCEPPRPPTPPPLSPPPHPPPSKLTSNKYV